MGRWLPASLHALRRIVDATGRGFLEPFLVLRRKRELIRLLIRRDIIARTSGTLLGWIWLLGQPALQVLAFWFLLDFVLRVRTSGKVAFIDYFLTGMIPWLFISEALQRGLSVLNEFGSLYQRTIFPLKVLPLLPILAAGMVYTPIYVVVSGWMGGGGAAFAALWIMLGLAVWLVPMVYLLTILGCFLRDLRQLFPFFLNILFYLTPILYLPDMLPTHFRILLSANPFADVVALIHGMFHGMPVTLGNILRPLGCWMLLLAPSWVLFRRLESQVREVL